MVAEAEAEASYRESLVALSEPAFQAAADPRGAGAAATADRPAGSADSAAAAISVAADQEAVGKQ